MLYLQQGFDQCMHLVFPAVWARDVMIVSAVLTCHQLASHDGSCLSKVTRIHNANIKEIFAPDRPWMDTWLETESFEFLCELCELGPDERMSSHSRSLLEFFNNPTRAGSLLITEETYAAAARRCIECLSTSVP